MKKCISGDGTTFAVIPTGTADCIACEEGRKRVAAKEAHAAKYKKRTFAPARKRVSVRPWKDRQVGA